MPDLALVGATALLPMVVATRIVRTAGAASAACGVYLLPASSVSLLLSSVPPPPLLLVPAIVFDLAIWLAPEDLTALLDLLPNHRRVHRRAWTPRQPTTTRSTAAGAAFGLALALVEPSFRVFLGGDPSVWFGPTQWPAAFATTVVCAAVATLLTARGKAA